MMEQNKPTKTCEYCGSVGPAFTFMNGETICQSCFSRYPVDGRKCRHRIRELEAELEDAIQGSLLVKQMKRIAELESELAALRQQQGEPVAEVVDLQAAFPAAAICPALPVGTKLYLKAAPRQHGEPVAWRFKNNSGDAVTVWLDYVPQEIEAVERQAREAGGVIEYAYSREAAPRVPDVTG